MHNISVPKTCCGNVDSRLLVMEMEVINLECSIHLIFQCRIKLFPVIVQDLRFKMKTPQGIYLKQWLNERKIKLQPRRFQATQQ